MFPENEESFNLVKSILLDTIPKDISLRKHKEDNVLLVTNKNQTLFFFNDTAALFLSYCNGKLTVKEIIDKMSDILEVQNNILTDDIVELIRILQKDRIVYIKV